MYKWGARSIERMTGVHPALIECATRALSKSNYDMTVPWMAGVRTPEQQNEIFKAGASKADGFKFLSNHQSGLAVDIQPVGYNKEESSQKSLSRARNHFAQLMFDSWNDMVKEGVVLGTHDHHIHWGGLWGSSGWDKPHFEMVEK